MFVPVSQLDCPLPYWQTLFNFESPVHSTEVGEQYTIIKYWWKYFEQEFPAQNHLTHEKTYSSIISIKVERQWYDFIFHISTSKQQTVLGMFSMGKNLRGTSGACRILFAVMADRLLANLPGYPGGKIIVKWKESAYMAWHVQYLGVGLFREGGTCVSLHSEVLWDFQDEPLSGRLEMTSA